MDQQRPKGKSPYQKYRKAPFRYSDLFYQWFDAVTKGQTGKAARLARQHTARFLEGRVLHEEEAV